MKHVCLPASHYFRWHCIYGFCHAHVNMPTHAISTPPPFIFCPPPATQLLKQYFTFATIKQLSEICFSVHNLALLLIQACSHTAISYVMAATHANAQKRSILCPAGQVIAALNTKAIHSSNPRAHAQQEQFFHFILSQPCTGAISDKIKFNHYTCFLPTLPPMESFFFHRTGYNRGGK